jgi:hypothetical protein
MEPYFRDSGIVIYHADLRDLPDLGPAAWVVTSPPYNAGVAYDVHDDALADEDYRSLAGSAAGLIATSLRAEKGRAWVNVGVTQLHCWLDALRAAGLASSTTVAWDYGLATADTAWGSWQSPSAPHLRYGFEPVIRAWGEQWRRTAPAGFEHWRDELGRWPELCRNVWRIAPGSSARWGAPGRHAGRAGGPGHPAVHLAD